MSRGSEIFNMVRTTYLRLVPHLRRPVRIVFATTTVGALLLGPLGVFPGAAAGAAATHFSVSEQWIHTVVALLLAAVANMSPSVIEFIRTRVRRLLQYLGVLGGNRILEHDPHEN